MKRRRFPATRPSCRRSPASSRPRKWPSPAGVSDSFALRIANHSDQIHSKYRPEGKNARAVFEAVEQARVEALGARAMPGMAQNLNAALEDRFAKAVVNRSSNRQGCAA